MLQGVREWRSVGVYLMTIERTRRVAGVGVETVGVFRSRCVGGGVRDVKALLHPHLFNLMLVVGAAHRASDVR